MHLLATELAALDEAETAIDLGQSPADIVVLSFADSDLNALAVAWNGAASELPTLRLASLKRLKHPMSIDLYIERVACHARLTIVRCLGGLDYWRYGLERLAIEAGRRGIIFAALPGDDRQDPRLSELSTAPLAVLAKLDAYFRAGGQANALQMLRYSAHVLGHSTDWLDPIPAQAAVWLNRDGSSLQPNEPEPDLPMGRPLALVLFYRALILAADTAPVLSLKEALEREGLAVRALGVTSLKDPAAVFVVSQAIAEGNPAVIVNATAFSAMRDDGTTVLDTADVPVLQVVLSGSARPAWAESSRGLSPTDIAMNVVLPELDGRILTRAISFKADSGADPRLEFSCVRHEPDSGRVSFVARQAAAWAKLGTKPPSSRRMGLVLSDYPARAGRAGYAVGLDTAASTAAIAEMLVGAGYDLGPKSIGIDDADELLAGRADRITIPLSDYMVWLSKLPNDLQAQLSSAWGQPQQDICFRGDGFEFNVLRAGTLLVALQPDRGIAAQRKSDYHDANLPPRHAYVAFYLWLQHGARIDALVHLGTHGTLEWLPGKALALSDQCWPEVLLGPRPVIYPFIVNNPGEAMQAKRRLAAVTIGHLTPPLSLAGLYGTTAELESLVEEYVDAEGLDRRRLPLLEAEIIDRAWSTGLAAECGLRRDMPVRDAIALLDARLCDLKELSISDRLHVFGKPVDEDSRRNLASTIVAASSSVSGKEQLATAAVETAILNCAAKERHALLAALEGRRVPPGPSGAPSRGRMDVLPTGRNLTSADPRSIPTRVAAAIGSRGAEEVIRRHLQDNGEYPRALVLDVWASASLRTGGDDLAQALSYLGVRPQWEALSSRVVGVEVLPLGALGRPRIDVTLRVSGLFRDIFESQIALFCLAVDRVASLEEEDDDNPLAAARRRGESLDRVYGGAPGTYGAASAATALDTPWQSRADLGDAYLSSVTHAFAGDGNIAAAGDAFKARIDAPEALVHPQDDRERDVLSGDGVADYAGGFAAAAASMGLTPALYQLDSSTPASLKVRTLEEEVARVVRGRLCNPRWLNGMLGHGARGVAEIAQSVDALYAFSATADVVQAHIFDLAHGALIADDSILLRMIENNAQAAEVIVERLTDALRRGLWVSRRNAVADELTRAARLARAAVDALQEVRP